MNVLPESYPGGIEKRMVLSGETHSEALRSFEQTVLERVFRFQHPFLINEVCGTYEKIIRLR